MRYLVTGAGQIGTQLTLDLLAAGHRVTVVRRGTGVPDGADLVRGDAGDRDLLRRVTAGPVAAVFHCIHTTYDSRAWAADLPDREQAVMDVAAEAGVPVVFPESGYAFGTAARDLDDRTAAGAVTGTVAPASSVFHLLVFGPAAAGKRAWVLGDPDVPRSTTWIPDLTAAMAVAAGHADDLALGGTAVLLAPTALTMTQRQMAEAVSPDGHARVSHIPWWILRVAGVFSPMMRELRRQRYLWDAPAVVHPGVLEGKYGLQPTPQDDVLACSHRSHS